MWPIEWHHCQCSRMTLKVTFAVGNLYYYYYYYYYYYKISIARKFKHARVGGAGVAGWENGLAGEGK